VRSRAAILRYGILSYLKHIKGEGKRTLSSLQDHETVNTRARHRERLFAETTTHILGLGSLTRRFSRLTFGTVRGPRFCINGKGSSETKGAEPNDTRSNKGSIQEI